MTTRNSKRVRTFAMLVKNVDQDQRQSKLQSYLDMLESDYYESPNKLAEEELSDQSINKKKLKITKKVKPTRSANLRRNVNLKKMLKQQPFTEFPNFINIAPTCQYKKPDHCKSKIHMPQVLREILFDRMQSSSQRNPMLET
ncbi:hypothetical protein pb186bvf_001160 [Paramecium bursaria]